MTQARETKISQDRIVHKIDLKENGKIRSQETKRTTKSNYVSIENIEDHDLVFHVPAVSYLTYRGIRTEAQLAIKRQIRKIEKELEEDED